ncbi:hypothetical protein AAG570_001905 [Ranatra chinensis]|uniref:MKRN2 opposite strand protein-like C-terminal domain-containing protein n=1 Tax=Ranatra chinensis TaxID=642074 RepID=A0ABD0Y9V9_9HEMI
MPEYCPVCRIPTDDNSNLLPFRVPYPFVRASQHPCSVLIKPTNGDFLHDYNVTQDLHIGVTNSLGKVMEFDRCGLHRDRTNDWNQSLVVYKAEHQQSLDQWDYILNVIAEQDCWTPTRYNEETFNCYTFALAFVKCLKAGPISQLASSKTNFCEAFVSPRVTNACKYINLYRRLRDSGYYVNRQS